MGDESLLIQCARQLLDRGHRLEGVVTGHAEITSWCEANDVLRLDPRSYAESVLDLTYDYLFSIANVRVVPEAVIQHARKGAINFHDGPLPQYAGLNTPAWAIINQEPVHGVTWHLMTEGIDAGDILIEKEVPIADDETALTLNTKCFEAGASSFATLIEALETRAVSPAPQDASRRHYFARHKPLPNDGVINWAWPADRIDALVRGTEFGAYRNPLGTATCIIDKTPYRVSAVDVLGDTTPADPGTVVKATATAIVLSTEGTDIALTALESLSGESLSIEDLVARHHIQAGARWACPRGEEGGWTTEDTATLSRHEAFWVRGLQRAEPTDLPYPARHGSSQIQVSTQGIELATEPKPHAKPKPDAQMKRSSKAERSIQAERTTASTSAGTRVGRATWDADEILAAVIVYLTQLTRQETLTVGYRTDQAESVSSMAAPVVPLTASVDCNRPLERTSNEIAS
jgi:methionyl-tRNA formyltransferase